MQESTEAMLAGHTLHERHEEHVMVNGQVSVLENGSHLKLIGSHLVVTCLHGNAKHQSLYLEIAHESSHTLGNRSKVVVVHLLIFGRVVSHERAACQQQVGTCGIESFIHEEVLLLPAEIARHLLHGRIEVVTNLSCSHVDGFQGTQEGRFVVERLAAITDEYSGDDERVVDDEDRACGVPCRITTSLEGGANAATWERRGVGFLLNEELTAEFLNHASFTIMFDERVMFLGRAFCQGLEPVRIVRHAVLLGPRHHAGSHSIGHLAVEAGTIVDDIYHFIINVLRQVFIHLLAIEDMLAKVLLRSLAWYFYVKRLLLECLADNLESQIVCHNCVLLKGE